MHSNRLITFLHAERAQCTFCRQEGELGPAARGEEELPEAVISDGWADGDAGDSSRWRCSGRRWFQAALLRFFLLPYAEATVFLSPRYLLFLSSVSPLLFPFLSRKPFCFSLLVSPFFLKNCRTLSLGLPFFFSPLSPPVFSRFSPFFLPSSLCLGSIYRGRGSMIDPAPSHHLHGV